MDPTSCKKHKHGTGHDDSMELELWKDMSVALALSKTIGSDQSIAPSEKNSSDVVDDCHHDFVMKDDLGIVCCVCGLIQQRIENIFEIQWKKVKENDNGNWQALTNQ